VGPDPVTVTAEGEDGAGIEKRQEAERTACAGAGTTGDDGTRGHFMSSKKTDIDTVKMHGD
jgi:hypothetical protein